MTWKSLEILVVDDSITDQVRTAGLIKKFLPEATINTASDGSEAIQRLGETTVDVVVTDLVMPEQDGRDLLDFIQNLPNSPAVILVTSQGDERVAAECLRRGAAAYLRKQNLPEELEKVLKQTQATVKENSVHRGLMARVIEARCEFEIDSGLSQIQALSNFLLQRLKATTEVSTSHLQKIIGSVREAMLNAHFHGNLATNDFPLQRSRTEYMQIAEERLKDPSFTGSRIQLILNHEPKCLSITIRDEGTGFDQSAIHRMDAASADRGNGIKTMLDSMTNVTWNDVGNEVTLTDNTVVLRSAAQGATSDSNDLTDERSAS